MTIAERTEEMRLTESELLVLGRMIYGDPDPAVDPACLWDVVDSDCLAEFVQSGPVYIARGGAHKVDWEKEGRRLLVLRVRGWTLKQIASLYGVQHQRVHQVERRILRRMRSPRIRARWTRVRMP